MPFTVSHPAAVWPLARWGLPVAALVIGSVTPDTFMMLPIPEVVHFAHLPLGLVTLDLAVGVAIFMLWQVFYAPALAALAPLPPPAPLPAPRSGKLRDFGRIGLAVLLGATTHLVWDSFTHDWMWGTRHIAWLAARHGPLMGFQWVRSVSDVVGLAVITAWVIAWWRKAPVRPEATVVSGRLRALGWLVILGPAATAFCVLLVRDSFYAAITTAAGLGVVGLTSVATFLRLLKP